MPHISKKFFSLLMVLFASAIPMASMALGGPGDPGCDPLDPACPIDGGLGILLAAGIGLGAKKAYEARKKKDETTS
ncbi:MAG TPA: hypothetical protein PKY29_08690 [Ferruginibacter sp.]|nr:hypothetical protein [Ferruginibacter sp.]